MQLTFDYKQKVISALIQRRENFDGSDKQFASQFNINNSVYSRIKSGGDVKGLLRDAQWLSLGRELNVFIAETKWNIARTEVFSMIEEDINFCKEYSKSLMCADDCGIGKTETAKYLSRTTKNCFYVDAKQAKSKQLFVKLIAKTIGIEIAGKYAEVKASLKYYLHMLERPIIIIDDAGYLEYNAHMELLELIDATEGICGWYQIGDDSLQMLFERGMSNKKVGYKAMFSRFGKKYTSIVPKEKSEKLLFYKKLIREVISANATDGIDINRMVTACLRSDNGAVIGDLRRAQNLLILNS